jgi:ABC-type phosphate transport system substrate-binding protein
MRLNLFILGILLAEGIVFADPATKPEYVVIVHVSNPSSTVERKFLENAFLKRSTTWSNGENIRPVDLGWGSAVRRSFSQGVLNRSVVAVKNYWQQKIFSGRDVPPPELNTEEDIVRYVSKYPGGVGYVSSDTEVRGVKIVQVK